MYVSIMADTPKTIDALFEAFGSIKHFAELVGCGYEAARQMRRRGSIPVQYWPAVVAACEMTDVSEVDYGALARMTLGEEHPANMAAA